LESAPIFNVGNLPIYGDLILAPMDGLSSLPFRSLVRSLGSAMSYTEFINAIDVVYGSPHLADRLVFAESERPIVFQLLDNDPDRLLAAALKIRPHNPDVIDINMGCCARGVSGRGAGSGLLRAPKLIAQMVSTLSQALDIPITAKIRLGWDDHSRNYLEVAHILEDSGAKLIAVHGRTRHQSYSGIADWDAIAEVKRAVSIPVIGNGDVRTVADIDRIKDHTGCDAVMIGRAALGNPWIFSRLDRSQVPVDLVISTMRDHLTRMQSFHGADRGLVLFRKFAVHYLKPYPTDRPTRLSLMTCTDPEDFFVQVHQIINRGGRYSEAPLGGEDPGLPSLTPAEDRRRMPIDYY
jgi:tRNA-dihydrouridine synthase B